MNKTIIYYTSNREDINFERKVRNNILYHVNKLKEIGYGEIPIISVSQKPIQFGDKNICVGDVGASGFNMFRQVQLACEMAKTEFVISCEADCLYPQDYFEYTPPRNDTPYRTSDLYVMPDLRSFYFHKEEGATHAQVVGREFYLERLNKLFEGAPDWSISEKNFPRERHRKLDVFDKIEHFRCTPVVQIKTHKGMRYYTHSDRTPIYTIDYWGDGKEFRKKYYENN